MRRQAAGALGQIGPGAAAALSALTDAVGDPDPDVQLGVASALANIAVALQDTEVTSNLPELRKARDTLTTLVASDPTLEEYAGDVRRAVAYLEQLWWRKAIEGVFGFVGTHPYISLAIAAYPLLAVTWLLFFWLRPLALLRINDALQPYIDFTLPAWLGGLKVPLRYVLLVGFFHYRLRVLDAWVKAHVSVAREGFKEEPTVAARTVHIDLPVVLDGTSFASVGAKDLRPVFTRHLACLLIQGEGGAGKTHLACQIARWAMAQEAQDRPSSYWMLPVLIEHELGEGSRTESDLSTQSGESYRFS